MKLKKYISYIGLLLLGSCAADDLSMPENGAVSSTFIDGDKIVVNVTIDAPDMSEISTRALGLGANPDYNDMKLYMVEFDDNGSPLVNTLKTVYTPSKETPETDRVRYKVELNNSDQARVLHLIAVPKSVDLNIEYGIEAQLIPSLKTDQNNPAYWQRLSFPNGYSTNGSPTSELDQLNHVALIRNFAEISVTVAEGCDFTLSGFAIVNNPDQGTIAPFNISTYKFPEFLKTDDGTLEAESFSVLSGNYSGIAPVGMTLSNQENGPVVKDETSPKFMYERPFNSIRHTYIILKGRRSSDLTDTYYKLDIGKNDVNGIFRYYSILRNYRYNIRINSVEQKGYANALDAAQGVVYNNFSFDIGLSSMLNISDGKEIVYVNFTTAVLTDPFSQEIEFKYRYRSLLASSPTYNNDDVNFLGLEPGTVIEEVTKGTTNDSEGWRTVKLKIKPAEYETRTQSFTIVNDSGLGRTINLILHRKWNMTNVKEFAGQLENWNSETKDENTAGDEVGENLTIFFDIPDNLEEAMFPLTFTLEADRQNIENDPVGRLIVTSGPSGFNNYPELLPLIGSSNGVSGNRIQYEKEVTWTEYNDPLDPIDKNDNGTTIYNGDGTKTHRIRCRFRTTTALTEFDFNNSTTYVLITNPNFNYAYVTFDRKQ